MTIEEKQKCAEVFKMLTGQETQPQDWNESAANLLAEMVAKVRDCSNAMDFVPRPPGWKPNWTYVVKYVYESLKNRSTRSGNYYEACLTAVGSAIKRKIEIELQIGN
ncbi:hypothetical protein [Geobacter sp.]|uniref:hypothetical protein n=1 Tax=Geobacter sp. TaxID=46610 RepID=UPI0027B87E93|nr:hypothetical protein [Geobacter sp.]